MDPGLFLDGGPSNIATRPNDAVPQGLLVAHEVWVRLSPPWMPRPVRQPAFTLKVLEALTPQGTRDVIDSERYELLGDGVLKGMAARHVFQAGRGDEGQMSLALCRLVSNGTLHRVAVVRLCCPLLLL